MTKTEEEVLEYIHHYKSSALEDVNKESQRLLDLGNDADQKLGSHLITLSSALIAVVGAALVSQGHITNDGTRFELRPMTFNLLSRKLIICVTQISKN